MESGPGVVQVGRTAGRQGPGRTSATLAPDADPVFAQMQAPVTPSGLSVYLPPVHFTYLAYFRLDLSSSIHKIVSCTC